MSNADTVNLKNALLVVATEMAMEDHSEYRSLLKEAWEVDIAASQWMIELVVPKKDVIEKLELVHDDDINQSEAAVEIVLA